MGLAVIYGAVFLFGVTERPMIVSVFSGGLAILSIWLSVVDFKHYRIPDMATLGIAVLGGGAIALVDKDALALHLISATIVTAVLWVVSEVLFRRLGKEAFGLGDVKLIGASTIWVGPFGIASVILFAALGGIALVLLARDRYLRVAFGPFLALATFIVWLHGPLAI